MIFWIVLALVIVAFVLTIIFSEDPEFTAPATLFTGAIVLVVVCFIGLFNPGRGVMVAEEKVNLAAVASKDGIQGVTHGGIFVVSGYVSDRSTLSYIVEYEDGGFHADRVGSDRADIYEDEQDQPYLLKQTWDWYADFWVPWNVQSADWYEFHVPKGSVTTNLYEVSP